ncbi:helicase associated domain-containing protein [Curtobacterium citreum]
MPHKPQFSSPELKKTADALRKAFEEGRIGPRVEALVDAVHGPKWKERRTYNRLPFAEVLEHLRGYVEEHGHAAPPQKYRTDTGFALGQWVMNYRNGHNGVGEKRGDPAEERLLEALPGWSWGRSAKAAATADN